MRISKIFLSVCLCAAVALNAGAARADNFRIIDMRLILAEAKAAKAVGEKIESARQKFKNYVTSKDEELRSAYKSLEENRSLLAPEEFKSKKENFNTQLGAIQTEARQKDNNLRKAHNEAVAQIEKAVLGIVRDLSQQDGFEMAFSRTQVMFYKPELDITDKVITLLNQRLPQINVNL